MTAPVAVGDFAEIESREMQEIETVKYHGSIRLGVLHGIERRLAVRVERDQLPVEHHGAHRLLRKIILQLRKPAEVESAPRFERDAVPVNECERPIAIELRLPHPVGAVE